MNEPHDFGHDAVVARAADGSVVIVLYVTRPTGDTDLEQLVADARAFNARAI